MSVKVTIKAPALKRMSQAISSETVQRIIADEVIRQMRRFIRIGTSPVLGARRFDAYKDKTKYPGDKKMAKPVNLELSGDMLNAITHKVIRGGVRIGIFDKKQADKATTHIRGLNGVPQRKFMPVDDGDQFVISIQRAIRSLYVKIISDILKK